MANYQAAPTPAADYPGKTLGLVGMILAIIPCTWGIGLILSIVAFVQSRGVGIRNQKAFIGIIVGVVWGAFWLVMQITGALANLFAGIFSG
jgi:hypothetical protein